MARTPDFSVQIFCIGSTVKRPTPKGKWLPGNPAQLLCCNFSNAKNTMMNSIVNSCAVLDVHKMIIVATIQAEQDDGSAVEKTRSFGTFRKHRRQLCRWLNKHDVELVIMESTGIYWKSIYQSLEDAKVNTFVVNAQHAKQVPGRKTDVQDSQWLATLGRFGLLRPSSIPPRDLRELRMLTRQRQKLQGMFKVRAPMFIVEIGVDMERFGSKENLASWAGMCPGNNESAGKRKSGKTRKGNRAIRRVLCEVSNAARRTNSQLKGKYQGLVIRWGHKRAIVAVGH